jgi:hypothetical protein
MSQPHRTVPSRTQISSHARQIQLFAANLKQVIVAFFPNSVCIKHADTPCFIRSTNQVTAAGLAAWPALE